MFAAQTTIPEDLLLLCVDPVSGTVRQPPTFRFALAGGIVAELLAAGALTLDSDRLFPPPADRVADPLSHPALEQARTGLLSAMRGPRPGAGSAADPGAGFGPSAGLGLRSCLNRLSSHTARPFLDSLAERGLLRTERTRVLGLFPVTRHHVLHPGVQAERRALIDSAIQSDASDASDAFAPYAQPSADLAPDHTRSLRLAALAAAGDLDRRLYPGPEGRQSRRRLRELRNADPIAHAVNDAVTATRSAG